MNINCLTVTEINSFIKESFDNSSFLRNISIKGEISNFKGANKNGNYYFKLIDENSSIQCVIFKFQSYELNTNFKDGDKVILYGSVSVYLQGGCYQLIVNKIEFQGEGDILLAKKKLIEKLEKEGLFSKPKKPIPLYPNKIAVIVGKNSAAYADIKSNIFKRWKLTKVDFYFSLVQGIKAVDDIINKVSKINSLKYDLIIIARGGGSNEDLSVFDNEKIVRAFSNLNIPFISAIGHEINKSILDMISDKYVSTPTEAAIVSVPDSNDIKNNLLNAQIIIKSLCEKYISNLDYNLNLLSSNYIFKDIKNIYDKFETRIDQLNFYSQKYIHDYISSLDHKLELYEENVDKLNPYNVLKKGYVLIKDKNNNIIGRSNNLKKENNAKIIFYDKECNVIIKKED